MSRRPGKPKKDASNAGAGDSSLDLFADPPTGGPPPKGGAPPSGGPPPGEHETYLVHEARTRYLNYALSVITSRALPDVRDGLKPVQRRILFTMRKELGLTPDARYKKSAAIVGDVMGKYHPHGNDSIYEAMVRLAQPWVMRLPLVDGQGNFGSPDGDGAAAFRYTEAKLRGAAIELLSEIDKHTVAWRPSFDGSNSEPVVLPARFPHLLVNGSQGIAVGMATSIPPHNLGEVIDACVAQIDAGSEPLTTKELLKHIKGPDFPTGGQLIASRADLHAVYETGSGSLKLRGEYKLEERKGAATLIVLTSIPYGVVRGTLVEQIADIIINRKLAPLVDVRDESTSDARIVLEIKKGTDPQLVMAYLYKNTSFQTAIGVNLTCLVPPGDAVRGEKHAFSATDTPIPEELSPCTPERLSLSQMIRHFLEFRMLTVERRLAFDLAQLRKRIHILDGFVIIFDAIDETIRIIRKSEGKSDAAAKLIERFALSAEQVEAILELRLHRLAKLAILEIREELAEKAAAAKALEVLLKSEAKRWTLIKGELAEIKATYGDKRRMKVAGTTDEPEYAEEDFIVAEDASVVLTHQGWIKRVREIKDLATTRVREGDSVLAAVAGSTKSMVAFFSSLGACYVMRIHDVPSTTGYGEPVQKFFKMEDGERIIACLSFDPRVLSVPAPVEGGEPQSPFAVAVTRGGLAFRFSLSAHREASTRSGRLFGRLNAGDEIVMVGVVGESDGVIAVANDGHVLGVAVSDLALLSGAGKGSMFIKLDEDARVVGAQIVLSGRDSVTAETSKGKSVDMTYRSVLGKRAQTGQRIVTRDTFARIVPQPVPVPTLEAN